MEMAGIEPASGKIFTIQSTSLVRLVFHNWLKNEQNNQLLSLVNDLVNQARQTLITYPEI